MTKTITEAVYQAIGEGSMCWMPRPEGVFLSTEAMGVAERAAKEVSDMCSLDKTRMNLVTNLQTVLDHLDQYSGRGEMTDKSYHILYDKVMAIIMDLTKETQKGSNVS